MLCWNTNHNMNAFIIKRKSTEHVIKMQETAALVCVCVEKGACKTFSWKLRLARRWDHTHYPGWTAGRQVPNTLLSTLLLSSSSNCQQHHSQSKPSTSVLIHSHHFLLKLYTCLPARWWDKEIEMPTACFIAQLGGEAFLQRDLAPICNNGQ